MLFTVIANPTAKHQVAHQTALAQGLNAHGIDVMLSTRGANTECVACWGWHKGKKLHAAGHQVLVMERGYLGDRFAWTSLAWNGLNGRGQFPAENADPARFHEHFQMQPWKQGGDYVLILGQVPRDASLQGRNLMPWYETAARRCSEIHKLPVLFRPHPLARGQQVVKGAGLSSGTLDEALAEAALAVTYNSNSGVDAVIAGVPTIAADPGSMAWSVTGRKIHEIVRPDRERWASALAWKQWRLEEIISGAALVGLLPQARSAASA